MDACALIQTLQEAGNSKSIDRDELKEMLSLDTHVEEFTSAVVQVRITGNGYKERR